MKSFVFEENWDFMACLQLACGLRLFSAVSKISLVYAQLTFLILIFLKVLRWLRKHSISASSVAFFEYFQEYISSHLDLCFQCSTHLSYTVSEISKWQSPNSLSAVAVVFVFVIMNKTKTKTTASVDKEFGDWHFDILENSKRLVRATLKTYERTGTYVFLKFFKKSNWRRRNWMCATTFLNQRRTFN